MTFTESGKDLLWFLLKLQGRLCSEKNQILSRGITLDQCPDCWERPLKMIIWFPLEHESKPCLLVRAVPDSKLEDESDSSDSFLKGPGNSVLYNLIL